MSERVAENRWPLSRLKRVADVAGALCLAPVAAPVILAAAAAKWIERPRENPFFVQQRLGRGNRRFPMIKIRTLEGQKDYGGIGQGPEDTRATRVGRILRRTAIDELPQLWHILAGDMSFTGLRAPSEGEEAAIAAAHQDDLAGYADWQAVRRQSRPGAVSSYTIQSRLTPPADRVGEAYFTWRARLDVQDYEHAGPAYDTRMVVGMVAMLGTATIQRLPGRCAGE